MLEYAGDTWNTGDLDIGARAVAGTSTSPFAGSPHKLRIL